MKPSYIMNQNEGTRYKPKPNVNYKVKNYRESRVGDTLT